MKLSDIIEKPCSGEWGTDDECGNGIPVLRTTNFTNEGIINYSNICTRTIDKTKASKKFLRHGDIIIEKSGGSDKQPVGRVVYFDRDDNKYLFNNFTAALRVKNKSEWEPKYVFFALFCNYLSGKTRMYQNKTTGLHNLQLSDYINNVIIPDSPLEIQREIAYNLDNVSEVIGLCRKILEKLDYLVKAKFTEMFGDVITNNMNWSSAALDDLCIIVRGGSPRPIEHFLGGSVPWIKIGDATEDDSIFLRSTKEHIIEEGVKKSRLIKSGSLIFANCGVSLGFARIITFDGCIHDGWLAFENISESLNKVFLLYSLNQITDYFRQIAPAGTQPNLNTAIMKSHTQIVPPLPLQEQFAEYVKKTDLAKSAVKKTLEKAQTLKNALMQKYFG